MYPNGEVTVRKSFDNTTKSLITNLALKNWRKAANHAFRHQELKEHTMEAVRITVSSEFKALSTSDTILRGRKPEEIAAFSNKVFLHEVSVFCPLWHACLKGACGITKAKSQSEIITVNKCNGLIYRVLGSVSEFTVICLRLLPVYDPVPQRSEI